MKKNDIKNATINPCNETWALTFVMPLLYSTDSAIPRFTDTVWAREVVINKGGFYANKCTTIIFALTPYFRTHRTPTATSLGTCPAFVPMSPSWDLFMPRSLLRHPKSPPQRMTPPLHHPLPLFRLPHSRTKTASTLGLRERCQPSSLR